jgi:RND family efflux transporter MFP subunit
MIRRFAKVAVALAAIVLMLLGLRHVTGWPDRSASARPDAQPVGLADRTRAPLRPAVTVARAALRDFVEPLFVSGTLVARDEVMVGTPLDGLRVTELLAEDGDRVEKGQVLARLDRSQLDALLAQNDAALVRAEAAIAQAKSQIEQFEAARDQATADLARARKLDTGVITQATLDQRVAAARSADAQLAAAQSALGVAEADRASRRAERRELMVRIGRTDVVTPVAGLVSRRTARLGAVAMWAGEALFRVIADGAIDLDAEVPEDQVARLTVGMRARLRLPGGESAVDGHVRLLSNEVDRTTRLGKVRIALPSGSAARIGSFASGSIEIARRTAIGVPASALQRSETGASVMLVQDGRVVLRAVEAGVTNRDFTEVRSGLAAGDTVVARAAAFLRDGDEVRSIDLPKAALSKAASR